MNVTPDIRKVLMALDSSPKAERYFTTGANWGLGILALIGHLVRAGYACRDQDGDLDITDAGKKALDESMKACGSRGIQNAPTQNNCPEQATFDLNAGRSFFDVVSHRNFPS